MKIKNWEKKIDNELFIVWFNKDSKEKISLFKKGTRKMPKNTVWIEDVEEGSNYAMTIKKSSFSNLEQALKYTYAYMKAHLR